jgi:hypothetical protein
MTLLSLVHITMSRYLNNTVFKRSRLFLKTKLDSTKSTEMEKHRAFYDILIGVMEPLNGRAVS